MTFARIIRAMLGVILAGLRTNYWQADETGGPKPYVSLKLDPLRVPDLPAPRDQISTKQLPEFVQLRTEVSRLIRSRPDGREPSGIAQSRSGRVDDR